MSVDAIGGLVEIIVWCFAWSIGTTLLALSRFNEPDARLSGLPARVWAALVVVWLWPGLFGAWFLATWLLWPLLAVGPFGFLVVLALGLRSRRATA